MVAGTRLSFDSFEAPPSVCRTAFRCPAESHQTNSPGPANVVSARSGSLNADTPKRILLNVGSQRTNGYAHEDVCQNRP